MYDIFLFILFVLSVHRVTRFIIRDCLPLISVPRDWLLSRTDPTVADLNNGRKERGTFMRSIGYLFQCEWCMSIWVSAGLLFALVQFEQMTWPFMIGWWLAGSSLSALLSERVEDEYEACNI